jgi:hypothetical protein
MEATEEPLADEPEARHRRELLREGVTMALYIGISLVAVMLALPAEFGPEGSGTPALTIFLTAMGLLVAHVVAFRLSTRFTHGGELPAAQAQLVGAQVAGGLIVTGIAVVPVILLPEPASILVSELLLIGLIAGVGYATARASQLGHGHALAYSAAAVVIALAVLWIKSLVPH